MRREEEGASKGEGAGGRGDEWRTLQVNHHQAPQAAMGTEGRR